MWQETKIWLMLFFAVCAVNAGAQFAGGTGTASDPWQVATAEHLNNVRNYLGSTHAYKYYIQTADIDLGVAPWNEGEGWVPIGTGGNSFYGRYNGNSKTVSGMYIARPNGQHQGLFGSTYNAWITDLGIINSTIIAHTYVGSLIGTASSTTIYRCFSTGSISAYSCVGGLIGIHYQGSGQSNYKVFYCYSRVNVTGNNKVGGLMGSKYYPISYCYSTGNIGTVGSSPSQIGGLVGSRLNSMSGSAYCYWDTETSGRTNSADGVGRSTDQMTYPYASDTYVDWDFYTIWKPDAGYSLNDGYPVLRDVNDVVSQRPSPAINPTPADQTHYLLNNVAISWQSGFNTDFSNPPTGFRIYAGTDNPPTNIANGIDRGLASNYNLSSLTMGSTYYWKVVPYNAIGDALNCPVWMFTTDWFAGGSGTEADPWQISDAGQLNNVRHFFADAGHFIQTDDIELGESPWNEGQGWEPISNSSTNLNRSYNGNGYIINGMFINRAADYQGLFGDVYRAMISNLSLMNVNVSGGQNFTGALLGRGDDYTTIVNCSSSGQVEGAYSTGGLAGKCNVSNSMSSCVVTGTNRVGGLIGQGSASICYSSGQVQGSNSVGGLVGNGLASHSHSSGSVIGGVKVGGLIGEGGATYSHSASNVSGSGYVGGLIGDQTSNSEFVYSIGAVSGSSDYIGGLIGFIAYWCYLDNSFSTSRVIGGSKVGGLIGGKTYGANVNNCYSKGLVSGSTKGGLIGYLIEGSHGGGVSNSYWDVSTSGTATSQGGTGRTTDQMTFVYDPSTYAGWNFQSTWGGDHEYRINDGYPFLLYTIDIQQVPSPVESPTPANGSQSILENVILKWDGAANDDYSNYATGYRLYMGTDNPPTNIANGIDLGWAFTYDPNPDLALNTTYYWQIVPYNSIGNAVNCPVWTFSTYNPNPVLFYPNGGELWHSGTTRTIRWNNNAPPQVKLWISYNNGTQWNLIAEVDGARGFYHYQVPSSNSSQCLIKLSSFYDEGLYDISNAVFSISTSSTQPKVVLSYPSANGIYLGVGQQISVSWTRQNVSIVGLDLSTDDGNTWNQIATGINANSYMWTVSDYPGSLCRLRVRSIANDQVLDISDNAFSISRIELLSPNGGELITSDYSGQSVFPITWSSANMGNVKIEYSTNGGSNWETVNASIPAGSGSYNWAVPGIPTTSAMIRISNVDNSSIADVSETSFTVRNPIRLVTANGGGFATNNSLFDIRWVIQDIAGSSTLHWEWSANGSGWTRINSTAVAVTDLSMAWFVETGNNPTVWLRAVESGTNRVVGKSEQPFTVTDKMLSIIEPNGGESYLALSSQTILWDHFGLGTVNIGFSPDDGANWSIVATNIPANNGAYVWQVPDAPSSSCRIRLQDSSYAYMNLMSQQPFTVLPVIVLPPEVDFTADVFEGDIPLAVQFTEAVDPGVGSIMSRIWDFGDGNATNQQNPLHIYATAGTYTVSLTVTNSYGGETTETKAGYIRALPNTPKIELMSPSSLGFGTVYLGDTSAPQTIRVRNFGTAILNLDPVSFFNPYSSFTLVSPALPAQVGIGDTLDLELVFVPATPGTVSDTLYINSDASNNPMLPVRLTGLGQIVPPAMVEGVTVNISGHDALISWQPVTETIYGTPVNPDFYIVLHSERPYCDEGDYVYLTYTPDLVATHYGVARFRNQMFYKVVAVKFYRDDVLSALDILRDESQHRTWGDLRGLLLSPR